MSETQPKPHDYNPDNVATPEAVAALHAAFLTFPNRIDDQIGNGPESRYARCFTKDHSRKIYEHRTYIPTGSLETKVEIRVEPDNVSGALTPKTMRIDYNDHNFISDFDGAYTEKLWSKELSFNEDGQPIITNHTYEYSGFENADDGLIIGRKLSKEDSVTKINDPDDVEFMAMFIDRFPRALKRFTDDLKARYAAELEREGTRTAAQQPKPRSRMHRALGRLGVKKHK